MKLTKKTDYALRVLVSLGEKGQGVLIPSRELAKKPNLSKILADCLSVLAKKNLLSQSGTWWSTTSQSTKDITILQVMEALEGPMSLMDCMEESTHCGQFYNCRIQNVLVRLS